MIRVVIADDDELRRVGLRMCDALLGPSVTRRLLGEFARNAPVSEATVKTHVQRVLAKLELRDRIHAAVFAFEHGLVRPGATD